MWTWVQTPKYLRLPTGSWPQLLKITPSVFFPIQNNDVAFLQFNSVVQLQWQGPCSNNPLSSSAPPVFMMTFWCVVKLLHCGFQVPAVAGCCWSSGKCSGVELKSDITGGCVHLRTQTLYPHAHSVCSVFADFIKNPFDLWKVLQMRLSKTSAAEYI